MKVVQLDSKRSEAKKNTGYTPQQSLAHYCQFFEKLDPDNFDLFPDFYHYRVRYSSPLHDVNGPDKIRAIFEQLIHHCESPKLIIRDQSINGQHGFVYWKFIRNSQQKAPTVVTGLTRIKFDGYGRVISHRDIWDTGVAPRSSWSRLRDWLRVKQSKKKRAAPPKKFHETPPL